MTQECFRDAKTAENLLRISDPQIFKLCDLTCSKLEKEFTRNQLISVDAALFPQHGVPSSNTVARHSLECRGSNLLSSPFGLLLPDSARFQGCVAATNMNSVGNVKLSTERATVTGVVERLAHYFRGLSVPSQKS